MIIETVLVTPELAAEWLNRNKINRSLKEGRVEQFASDMRGGKWTTCPMPISFYEDGSLADGQHRLFAVIEAKTAVLFIVLRGLSKQDGLNIDTGSPRSVVDNAKISGLDPTLNNRLVAYSWAIERGERNSIIPPSNSATIAVVNKHRKAVEFIVANGPKGKGIANAAVCGAVGRAFYHEQDLTRLARFGAVLSSGITAETGDVAAQVLRNYLIDQVVKGRSIGGSTQVWRDAFLRTQHAVRLFMKREPIKILRSVKDEEYPLLPALRN